MSVPAAPGGRVQFADQFLDAAERRLFNVTERERLKQHQGVESRFGSFRLDQLRLQLSQCPLQFGATVEHFVNINDVGG